MLPEKISTCHNNPKKSLTTKINKHKNSDYLLFTKCSFYPTKSKLDYYRSKDYMNKFCKDLKKRTEKIINYGYKEMISLTAKETKSSHKQKVCYICKKGSSADDDNEKHHKIKNIVIILENIEEVLVIFVT